jgi:hypothetical protein
MPSTRVRTGSSTSRETWARAGCVIAPFQWRWQFRGNNTFLEVSRKQDLVDRRGDMDSLFEKHRYLLRMQPPWMRPRNIRDHICLLENLDNGSMISGESTNESVGQGGRKTAILLDEFARVKDGEAIDLATRDTSACRIFNSTPQGPGTWFTKLRNSGRVKVFTMHWSRHPEKARGAGSEGQRQGQGRVDQHLVRERVQEAFAAGRGDEPRHRPRAVGADLLRRHRHRAAPPRERHGASAPTGSPLG